MKLLVATDAHIFRTPDGAYWCKSIYGYDFWKRYLNIFAARRKQKAEETIFSVSPAFLFANG